MKNWHDINRAVVGLWIGLILLASVGCKPETPKEVPPETVPVTGKVIDREGTPLANAMVEFRAVEGKPWTTIGKTAADGSFTLETLVNGERIAGAVVGQHRVSVMPPFSDNPEQSVVAPYQLRAPLEVTAEGENSFTIDMRK